MESKQQAPVQEKSKIEEEEKQKRVAILIESLKKTSKENVILEDDEDEDLEEYDDLDFEPEEDEEEQGESPVLEQDTYELSSTEASLSETHIVEEEEICEDHTSSTELNVEKPVEKPESTFEQALEVQDSEIIETALETESVNHDLEAPKEFILNEEQEQDSAEAKEEIELKNESYDPEFEPKDDEEAQVQEEETTLSEEIALPTVDQGTVNLEESTEPLLLLSAPNPEDYKEEEGLLLEKNPYYNNKKILSKKKPIFISILSIAIFIGVCISLFAILRALR